MSKDELLGECNRIIDAGLRYVSLVLPRPPGRGETMRMCGRSGPRGHLMNYVEGRGSVVSFDAREVLRFIERSLS
jgi:hypothetical protein